MYKVFHIIKTKLSYKQCAADIMHMLKDVTTDKLEIKIERIYSLDHWKYYVNLTISYFKQEVENAKKI